MKNKLLSISILVLSISLIFSSLWIGMRIDNNVDIDESTNITSVVFTITEVANYLKISEKEVQEIIYSEQKQLSDFGSFSGKMFPYFVVNNKMLFYKSEVDLWLEEVVKQRKEYK